MDEPIGPLTSGDLHATYLERSRKELQKKVEQLKRVLVEVCTPFNLKRPHNTSR